MNDRKKNLRMLCEFLAQWHGTRFDCSGESYDSAEPHKLRDVLKWFYALCGPRLNSIIAYNHFLTEGELDTTQLPVVFCRESQGVYEWGINDLSSDPEIVGRDATPGSNWCSEEERLTGFVLQLCLFDAIMTAPFGASASWCSAQQLDRILSCWSQIALGVWRWPAYPTRFYRSAIALAVVSPNEDGFTFKCGAPDRSHLKHLSNLVDEAWEYSNLG
jgi:hypothetical protein